MSGPQPRLVVTKSLDEIRAYLESQPNIDGRTIAIARLCSEVERLARVEHLLQVVATEPERLDCSCADCMREVVEKMRARDR